MRLHSRPSRLCATAAAGSLVLAPIWPDAAWAQAAPPPPPAGQGAAPSLNQVPPTRAGRLAQITGTVSFHAAEDTQWSPAVLNYPVTTGDSFWTEPQAQAALELSGNRFLMMSSTELDVTQLDDHAFAATLPQGEMCMALAFVPSGDTYAFQTPRGLVQIAATGNIAVVAGDTAEPDHGAGAERGGADHRHQPLAAGRRRADGLDLRLGLVPGQCRPGTRPRPVPATAPRTPGPGADAGDRPGTRARGAASVAPPQVVQEMTGYQDLQQYGSWQQSSSYGAVWYPQVASSWVPYREGRWAYVAPWGWTWVDSDPWGFAPFHYGRWVYAGNRWGWAPVEPGIGYGGPPCYAPALVSFFGIGAAVVAGAAVGAAIGYAFSGGNVGWVPLGWHEPYYPWYRVNNGYLGQVNRYNVTNVNQVINNYHNTTYIKNVQVNKYVNIQRAATVVPARAMVESRPVRAAVVRVPAAELARAQPVVARQPIRPAVQTIGVSRPVAQQLRLPRHRKALRRARSPLARRRRRSRCAARGRRCGRPPPRHRSADLRHPCPGSLASRRVPARARPPPRPGAPPTPAAARPAAPALRTPAQIQHGTPPVPHPQPATARPGSPAATETGRARGRIRPGEPNAGAPKPGAPPRPGTPAHPNPARHAARRAPAACGCPAGRRSRRGRQSRRVRRRPAGTPGGAPVPHPAPALPRRRRHAPGGARRPRRLRRRVRHRPGGARRHARRRRAASAPAPRTAAARSGTAPAPGPAPHPAAAPRPAAPAPAPRSAAPRPGPGAAPGRAAAASRPGTASAAAAGAA